MLKAYLEANECNHIFMEELNLGSLKIETVKKLSKIITSFILDKYSIEAEKNDICDVCEAAIDLFPSIKTQPSEVNGIVRIFFIYLYLAKPSTKYIHMPNSILIFQQDILYNDKTKTGFVFESIKYKKRQRKQDKQKEAPVVHRLENNNINIDETEELIRFFDACILPRDTAKVKDKLSETVNLRRNILVPDHQYYRKILNMYRVEPNLVVFQDVFLRQSIYFLPFSYSYSMISNNYFLESMINLY